jgi:hypothetical protein
MYDWIGSGVRKTGWRSFEEARAYVRSLGFKNVLESRAWTKTDQWPDDIPAAPRAVYKGEWINWGDWLGTGKSRIEYRPFKEARELCRISRHHQQDGISCLGAIRIKVGRHSALPRSGLWGPRGGVDQLGRLARRRDEIAPTQPVEVWRGHFKDKGCNCQHNAPYFFLRLRSQLRRACQGIASNSRFPRHTRLGPGGGGWCRKVLSTLAFPPNRPIRNANPAHTNFSTVSRAPACEALGGLGSANGIIIVARRQTTVMTLTTIRARLNPGTQRRNAYAASKLRLKLNGKGRLTDPFPKRPPRMRKNRYVLIRFRAEAREAKISRRVKGILPDYANLLVHIR